MTQDCKNVALKLPKISLKLPKISLSKAYFGQFKGYILCSGNVGGFFASEGGSCHRCFTIVLTFDLLELQSRLPITGVLNGEISGSSLGSAPGIGDLQKGSAERGFPDLF